MGLDMYAHARRNIPDTCGWFGEGFEPTLGESMPGENDREIHYWRKHPDLHDWMKRLAFSRGFGEGSEGFNYVWLRLTPEDLTQLYSDVDAGLETSQGGFFFGVSEYPEDAQSTFAFIEKARAAIAAGATIFYSSSW